jgi:hypothetical protein
MRQNNSVSLALKLWQFFREIDADAAWPSEIDAGTYHRLIWRFPRKLQTPVAGSLRETCARRTRLR